VPRAAGAGCPGWGQTPVTATHNKPPKGGRSGARSRRIKPPKGRERTFPNEWVVPADLLERTGERAAGEGTPPAFVVER
jgi:hypothetical protein